MKTTKQPMPPVSSLQPPVSHQASPYRDREGHVVSGEGFHRAPDPFVEDAACPACGLPLRLLQTLGSDGRHRTCSAEQGDPAEARWAVLSATDSTLFVDAGGKVVAQRWRNQRGSVLTAEAFHQSPDPDAAACPICGLASQCFKSRWCNRPHRARRQDDHPPEARWFVKYRQNCIHALGAAGKRLPVSLLATEPMRERLHQAAGRIAFGVPVATVAKLLGIKADTLYRCMVKYADVLKAEMKRAKDQGPSALQAPVERERKEPIPPWVRKAVRGATAAIAAGMTRQEVNESFGLLPGTIGEWQSRYRDLWQKELARAMEVSLAVVRQLAGTDAVVEDPDGYLRQARAAQRWAFKSGEPLFPARDETTLSSFYFSHYKPVRLADAARQTVETYELIVRRWVLLTGDPPLKEITTETLCRFRDCIARMAGRDRVGRRSSASVYQFVKHIQWILDKTGPPGPRNRDAAGIIPQPPWIKPPRLDIQLPRTVSTEHLDALYRSCVSADKPRLPGTGIKPPAWWRALLAVALGTGLRRGTLFKLRMEFIEWDKRLIIIPAGHLKARRPQIVCLSRVAIDHLRTIRTDRELVFPWPHGENAFYREFRRLRALAGIKPSDAFALQRIRKTTASLLWESSPQAAQFALGHSTDRVTKAYYVAGQFIMAKALDAMPLPAAFSEGLRPNGNGNGHNQGDAPDGDTAGNGGPGRKALDQLTTLLSSLGLPETTQEQILALAAAGDLPGDRRGIRLLVAAPAPKQKGVSG